MKLARVLRSLSVGVVATISDLGCLVLLVEISGLHVTASAFVAAVFGAVTRFSLSKTYAFRDSSALHASQVLRYLGMVSGSIVFVALSMHVLALVIGLPYLVAKAAGALLVFAGWSYPIESRYVFTRRTP
ncbi:MAG: GtrA family protein [Myxococcales bacterium]|nr:GtrA family protein [Myxococcales bacterium]